MEWSFLRSWWERNPKSVQEENIFSIVCMSLLHHVDKKSLCSRSVLKFGWTSTSNNLSVFTAVFKLSAFAETWSSNLPNNFELKCVQDHEYFLNKHPFATWKSYGLFPYAQVSEWFLLLSPGSSLQSSCEFLQPHLPCPFTIHGETGMNHNFSWTNIILPQLLRVRFT